MDSPIRPLPQRARLFCYNTNPRSDIYLYISYVLKVIALGAKHQTLLQRLVPLQEEITAEMSRHEARQAIDAEVARKVNNELESNS